MPLCGHATLASAHVLWRHAGWRADQPIDFATRSGVLRVSVRDELITMLFPSKPVAAAAMPGGLIDALHVTPRFCGVSDWFYLIELDNVQAVRAVQPDMAALKSHEKAVIVTAQAPDTPYDFVSRCFAPAAGIPEDPVTGSAHCALTGYWSERLGKRELHAYQASSRGGELWLRYDGDKVAIAGYAVTVAQGLSLV